MIKESYKRDYFLSCLLMRILLLSISCIVLSIKSSLITAHSLTTFVPYPRSGPEGRGIGAQRVAETRPEDRGGPVPGHEGDGRAERERHRPTHHPLRSALVTRFPSSIVSRLRRALRAPSRDEGRVTSEDGERKTKEDGTIRTIKEGR